MKLDPATPEELTLPQAAALLGYEVKTLRRLIKAKKLRARLNETGEYRIHRSDVWHILYDLHDWCTRCSGVQKAVRTREFRINETDRAELWDFNEGGEVSGCDERPEFEVTLGVADLRRLLAELRRPNKSREECEALREEFRGRIETAHRQRPERFGVVLKIDAPEGYELCRRIVSGVKPPKVAELPVELGDEATQHIFINALPHIGHVRSVESYLSKALINFYRDRLRYAGIGKKGVKKRAGRRDESVDLDEFCG